ncbi:MAG: flagellar biosynthetic protein FliO [Bacteriovoracaceae bacterium]|nr:flagellar biosynthetic protein FliO [Bacteriovoracaceae bacterium]
MKILVSLAFILTILSAQADKAKVLNVTFEDIGNEGRLIVQLDRELADFPELSVKNNFVQVAIPSSFVWPKIEKKFSVIKSFDSKILAYQFDKEKVRVRAILPQNMENKADRVALVLKGKNIIVNFPKNKTVLNDAGRSPALAPASREALAKKDPGVYDESYLDKLLKEKDSREEVKKPQAKIESVLPVKKDTVTVTQAAQSKNEGFSLSSYAGKFVGFLALVLLLFYGVVTLLKKGAFGKNKLGFLNSTKVIEVLNTTYIAPKRSLLLIRAHKQVFLVGSSEKGLHMISEVNDLNGLFKESEKQLSGSNFDSSLGKANDDNKSFKLKEFLDSGSEEEINPTEDSAALRAIEKEMAAAKESHKVKFSDQIKSKLKDLKPLQ